MKLLRLMGLLIFIITPSAAFSGDFSFKQLVAEFGAVSPSDNSDDVIDSLTLDFLTLTFEIFIKLQDTIGEEKVRAIGRILYNLDPDAFRRTYHQRFLRPEVYAHHPFTFISVFEFRKLVFSCLSSTFPRDEMLWKLLSMEDEALQDYVKTVTLNAISKDLLENMLRFYTEL